MISSVIELSIGGNAVDQGFGEAAGAGTGFILEHGAEMKQFGIDEIPV